LNIIWVIQINLKRKFHGAALNWAQPVGALKMAQLGFLARLAFQPTARNRGVPMASMGGGGRSIVVAAGGEVPMGVAPKA
jgi:hypothetical protein